MKVDVERLEKNKVVLDVEVDSEELDKALQAGYRRLVNRVNVPGFRKGKAPRYILERHVGKGAILNEAFKILFPDSYKRAVEQAGIEPVDEPEVDVVELEEGKPFKYKATVVVKPEVVLGDYKSIRMKPEDVSVTPEEVEREVSFLRERHAELVPDESGEVKEDSFPTIDFQGFVGDKELPGGAVNGFTFPIGSGYLLPGFEDQIKGARVGEEREIKVSLPSDYKDPELAGKEATFKVQIRDVKKKVLPELDDDFAKEHGYASLEEMRNDISNKLLELKRNRARSAHEESVLKEVVDRAAVDIPEVMVKDKAAGLMQDLGRRLAQRNISLEEYLNATGQTMEGLEKQILEVAERKVKTELVLEAIAAREGIKADEQEVTKVIDDLAAAAKEDSVKVRRDLEAGGEVRRIRTALTNDKVVKFLADTAEKNAAAVEGAESGGEPGALEDM